MGQYKKIDRGATVLAVGYKDIIVNGRVKYYPDRDGNLMIGTVETFSHGGFRRAGYEVDKLRVWVSDRVHIHDPCKDVTTYNPITGQDVTRWGYTVTNDSPDGVQRKYNLAGSAKGRSRARGKLYDLVRCNWQLDTMFTFTLDPTKIDRTAYPDIIKALSTWLANRVRRDGLVYVAVPEYHADGEAIHIHGLCNWAALHTIYSGVKRRGRMVYNVTDWRLGFSAAVRMGCSDTDRQRVSAYVCKYITKDNRKVGGRYFLHGGKLTRPTTVLREMSDDDVAQLVTAVPCRRWSTLTPMGTYTKITIDALQARENCPTGAKAAEKSPAARDKLFTVSELSAKGDEL